MQPFEDRRLKRYEPRHRTPAVGERAGRMHVALVTETYPPELNGVSLTVRRAVEYLREREHTVDVVRPRQSGDRARRGRDDDMLLPGMGLPLYPGVRFGFPAARRLTARWQERRPSVVHVATEGPLGASALRAAVALGIPVTTDYRTHFDRYSAHYGVGWLARPIEAYLRRFHNRSNLTFVSTVALQRELGGRGYLNVVQVGRGIDTDLFNPGRRSAPLRRQWGVDGDGLAVAYIGRLAAEKNLGLAERAFRSIRERCPAARMIWVGDGPARRRLQRRNPDHVFAGVRRGADLAAHYASADLFLFPSTTETFGNVTLEALASGLAVVAFDEGAAAQHAVDRVSARLVGCGDEDDFITAAAEVACTPALLERLRTAAPHAVEALTWPSVLAAFESHLLASSHGYRLYANA